MRGQNLCADGRTQKVRPSISTFTHQLGPNIAAFYDSCAFAYVGLGQYQRAIEDYDVAIRLDNINAYLYNGCAQAYSQLGQHAKAVADETKACSLDRQYC
jgi:tetratricopeptide (TPR) repeat protein